MFNLNKFIGEHVTHRAESMFAADISANSATLSAEIKDKKVCVIGGAAGLVLSFIAKWLIPVIFASRELRCVLPWWLAVCGVVFSGCVAIAAAWIPARKATLIKSEAKRS